MADAPVKESPKRAEIIATISPEINARMDDAATLFREVSDLFKQLPNLPGETETYKKEIDFYNDKAGMCQKFAGWYDPAQKKKAKVTALKAALAKLEAELAAN